MAKKVKNQNDAHGPRSRRPVTRISSKHQVTIPSLPFKAAGLEEGDALRAEAAGPGQVLLTRVDELLDCYSGAIDSGGELRGSVEQLRDEWR